MNITPGETRIAQIEGGQLAELYVEREGDQQITGNIYKGRITRVLPGMQAAFVDIGLEKAAFLYVSDVVPDLFEEEDEDEEENEQAGGEGAPPEGKRPERRPRRRRGPLPKIEELVKEGQSIVVQVAKDPIRTKGARITCHISLPGRYVVSMPTVDHVGVSRRLGSHQERLRLKQIISANRPAKGGFIARTISSGATEEALTIDMKRLREIWDEISTKQEKAKPPALIYNDLSLVLRSVRDLMSPDIDRLVIDSEQFMPDLANRVELYNSEAPLFDVYGIETEINRALGKKVWLKSGGYLIIDRSEALTAIDINTGRFVGRHDFEETILQTNLEAAQEIAYQLRLRNIGGIIIIDFIDMERFPNRQKVFYTFKDALRKDKVRTTISKISELGLVEMTRKRTREALAEMLSETCFYCNGKGHIKTPFTVAFEIFRELKRTFRHIDGRAIVVHVNPRVAQVLFHEARERLDAMERRFKKRILIETDETYHVEKFEITTKG